jgi:hypothetical protein
MPKSTPVPEGDDSTVKAGYRLYEQAKKSEATRKKKEDQNPDGCTFKPEITRGSSSNTTKGQERFNSLHQNAEKRAKSRVTLVENRGKEGCTFKPDINDRSKKMNKNALTGSKRFENLYNDAQKRRAKTQAEATTSATAGCTFTPRITKRGRQSPSPSTKDRFSLLYESNKKKSAAELEAQKAMRETKDCTFTPKTTQNSGRSRSAPKSRSRGGGESYGSIHERLFQSGKENRAKLDRAKADQENKSLESCTFKPSINHNPNRQQAIEASMDGADPFERLHRQGTKEDILAKLDNIRQEQAQQCTFKPRIIRRSVSAGKQRPSLGHDPSMDRVSVYDRLHSDMQVYEQRSSELREKKKVDELANCTFAPETNYDVILSRRAENQGAERRDLPVWERLQQNRQGVQMLRDEIKKQKDLEGCTFTPEVGREPLRRKHDTSIHERLSKQAKNYAMLSKLQEKHELENCTFRPKTNVSQTGTTTPLRRTLAEGEHIWDRLSADVNYQERDRELEAKRKQLELEGCTFKPRTTNRKAMSPEAHEDESSWTKDEIMDRLNSRIGRLSQPRDSAGIDKRRQIEQTEKQRSKMPGYQNRPSSASKRSSSAGRSRPSSASKERPSSRSSSRTKSRPSATTPSRSRTTPGRSSSASRARPSSSSKIPSTKSKTSKDTGSAAKSTDKFSDWQKEMEAKMQQALDTSATPGSPAAPSGGADSLESFNSWQAEIEAKMKDL